MISGVVLRTFAALSRAALLRDGHADLSFTMTVWIGLVTAGKGHFVGNLLPELRPKSLKKIPKVIIFYRYGTKRWKCRIVSVATWAYIRGSISIATRGRKMNIGGIGI